MRKHSTGQILNFSARGIQLDFSQNKKNQKWCHQGRSPQIKMDLTRCIRSGTGVSGDVTLRTIGETGPLK